MDGMTFVNAGPSRSNSVNQAPTLSTTWSDPTGTSLVRPDGSLASVIQGGYDVKAYGAIGNGTINDSAAITAANTAAVSSGGAVYFTPGNYMITSAVTLTAPSTWDVGATVSVATGGTLTVNNVVYAGNQTLFVNTGGTGTFGTFGDAPINARWFGAVPDFIPTAGTGTPNAAAFNAAFAARTYVPYPVSGVFGTMTAGVITLNSAPVGVITVGSAVTGSGVPGGTTVTLVNSTISYNTSATGTTLGQTSFTFTPATAATFGRRSVYIPGGIYRIESAISVGDGLDVQGDGKYQTIIGCLPGTTFTNGMVVFSSASAQYFTAIRDLSVQCPQGNSAQTAVYMGASATSSYMENVIITGFSATNGVGLNVFGPTNCIVRNCVIENSDTGILYSGAGGQFHSVILFANKTGMTVANGSAQNMWTIFNDLLCISSSSTALNLSAAKYCKFVDCAVSETDPNSLSGGGITMTGACTDITVNNLDIALDKGNAAISSTGYGMKVSGTSSNIRIHGGRAKNFLYGLYVDSTGTNIMVDSAQYYGNLNAGIYLATAISGNIKISDNQCYDNGKIVSGFSASTTGTTTLNISTGATIASVTNCSISGKVLTTGTATGTIVVGAWVYGTGVAANTYITGGSGTSWTVNISQTVSSTTMGMHALANQIVAGDTVVSTGGAISGVISAPNATHLQWTITATGNNIASVASTSQFNGNGIYIQGSAATAMVSILGNQCGNSVTANKYQYAGIYSSAFSGVGLIMSNLSGTTTNNIAASQYTGFISTSAGTTPAANALNVG
jgi:hypothetical protein